MVHARHTRTGIAQAVQIAPQHVSHRKGGRLFLAFTASHGADDFFLAGKNGELGHLEVLGLLLCRKGLLPWFAAPRLPVADDPRFTLVR